MSLKKNEPGDRATVLSGILDHLQDDAQALSYHRLTGLSDLNHDEFGLFKATWDYLNTERRCDILGHLQELAEDNIEYDFGAIFKYALSDASEPVRLKAIEGLWENEEPSLIHPLLIILAGDSATTVREAATVALGRFAILAECQKIEETNITLLSSRLLAVANNTAEPLPLRCRALESVAPLSLADVTQAIWAAYRIEEPEMHASAIQAMGLNRDPLWLPTIIQELTSDDPDVRFAAVGASGALGEVEATPHLIELLDDPDPEIRIAAVQALGNIGGIEAKSAIKRLLQHQESPLREAAVSALAEIELYEEPFSPPPTGGGLAT